MSSCFALDAGKTFSHDVNENVMSSIFKQYESVIIESLITSFGLDFLVNDRHGGDVDTIFNVRQVDKDDQMNYKNNNNKKNYDNHEKYIDKDYHKGTNYNTIKANARNEYHANGTTIKDAYTGNDLHFLGKSNGANPKINAELDHVIAAKSIHYDRGRVLSGIDGSALANSPENLQFTNKSLNASMQDREIPDYISKHPELPEEDKIRMMNHYNTAKSNYETKLARTYYTSPKFAKDVAIAAGDVSIKMGLRQALGFVFVEIWFAVKEEFDKVNDRFDLSEMFTAIGNGIRRGSENAKEKHKEFFSKFFDGAVAGAISSLTTTLCNIFFTTAKNVVKIIRQTYASIVQAAKVLFINPDNLPFGERMRAVTKIIALGASVVFGSMISEAIGATPIGKLPVVGDIVQTFCGTLVTGIMSCTLLHYFDRSKTVNNLVSVLNNMHTVSGDVNYFYKQAAYFENYAAELLSIDLEKFREETEIYNTFALEIENAKSETELNIILKNMLNTIGCKLPWEGEFSSFMSNKRSVLVFD